MSYAAATTPNYTPNNQYNQFANRTTGKANQFMSGNAITNPYNIGRFQGFSDDFYKRVTDSMPAGAGGSNGEWGFSYGGPNDPRLKGHLANLTGGTRNIAEQAVKDSAYAGPNRGGMNTVGGSDPRAAAAYQLTKALGSDYGNRYGQAADLTAREEGNIGENYRANLGLMAQLLGNELGAMGGSANFSLGQAGIGRDLNDQVLRATQGAEGFNKEKYFDEQNYQRGEEGRVNARQDRARQQNYEAAMRAEQQGTRGRTDQLRTLVDQDKMTPNSWASFLGKSGRSDELARLLGLGTYGSSMKKGTQGGYDA